MFIESVYMSNLLIVTVVLLLADPPDRKVPCGGRVLWQG